MIDIFTSQVKEFEVEMDLLLQKKDYDALGKLAHKAKSSVAILGMAQLSAELKDLELNCLEKKNTESYKLTIDNFKSECSIAVKELEDYKRNHLSEKN